jgi:hypothetical protein
MEISEFEIRVLPSRSRRSIVVLKFDASSLTLRSLKLKILNFAQTMYLGVVL